MITRYWILILTILSSIMSAQLRMELKLIGSVAEVTIINTSNDYYALPIDKVHLRPYEQNCNTFSDYEAEFPAFGLMLSVVDSSDEKMDYVMGYKSFTDINSVKKNIDRKRDELKRRIVKWADQNQIKDYNTAFINYFLTQNLVYLEPYEKFTFKIKVDLHNITDQELIFYSYNIKNMENYNLYVSLCEYNDLDKYLTSSQKKNLSKYKFFNTKLESNKIQLKK